MSPSAQAFRAALGKGSGRAMILLRQAPDDPALHAELLRACGSNLHYDGQSESSRAPYLHRLIQATGRQRGFWQELWRWLAETRAPDDGTDVAQAFHVLCLLAAEDASLDRALLHEFIGRASYDTTGVGAMMAFIRLEGLPALLLYVRRFADDIAQPDEAWSFRCLVEALSEREGAEAAASALAAARAACPELDRLMALDLEPVQEEPTRSMGYAAAREALAAGGRRFPWAWARHASPEELAQAARDLLAEHDARRLGAYLALFRRRPFPGPITGLIPLVRHEDRLVARDAAEILGRAGGRDLRALALELLDGERPWNGIRMLRGSLEAGDLQRIARRLDHAALGADGWHEAGLAVLDLLDEQESPPEAGRALLLRLYEEEPCSFCRGSVVGRLAALGGLPGWMAEECRHDAEPETVSLAGG